MPQAEIQPLLKAEFPGKSPVGTVAKLMLIDPNSLLDLYHKIGSRSKIQEAWLVPDICDNPAAIWKANPCGANDGDQTAYFYSGVPLGVFAKEHGKQVFIPAGKVMLVSVTDAMEVIDWRYCEEDLACAGFPVGHETRFGERLWPRD